MAEVAAHAGVSVATVSRVISGSRPVAEELRDSVTRAASELGYQVNLVGRALRRGRTATVGLLVPDLDNPFFSSLAQHLSTAFEGSDIDVLVFSTCGDPRVERRGVESFLGRQVDAIVIIPCHEIDSVESVRRAAGSTLTVQLDRRVGGVDVNYIACDNQAGMALISEHVRAHIDVEDQPVIYVGAHTQSSSGHERLEHFGAYFPDHPTYLGDFGFAWGQAAVDLFLRDGHTRATIVTAADIIALGVMAGLHARGYKVPDDFRVIGFDGIGVARLAQPTLTTVRQPVEQMAQAVLEFTSRTHPLPPTQSLRIVPELIPGESSPGRGSTR